MKTVIKSLLFIFLCMSCTHVFYQPSHRKYIDPRQQLKLDYKDVYFDSEDGTKLHSWFFHTTSPKVKGTVVQFHGNAQNVSTHFFNLIWLVEHGYNVYVFDYRGYGQSEGKPEQKGIYEDSLSALNKGYDLFKKNGEGKFIVFGQSLGGNILLRALPDFKFKNSVSLAVVDSSFSSYQDIAFEKISHSWLLFWLSPLAYLLVSDEYAAEDVMAKIDLPVLVIVGQKDGIIPQKFGKKIFKALKSQQKWLWKLPDGSHIDVFHHAQGIYRDRFLTLLDSLPQ